MFDFPQTLAAARTAVALRGEDFRYASSLPAEYPDESFNIGACDYRTDNNTPSCIVAWVFVILDIPAPTQNGAVTDSHVHDDRFSIRALCFLKAMQILQDQNITWGRALDLAAASVVDYDEDGHPTNVPDTLDPSRFSFVHDFSVPPAEIYSSIDKGQNILARNR